MGLSCSSCMIIFTSCQKNERTVRICSVCTARGAIRGPLALRPTREEAHGVRPLGTCRRMAGCPQHGRVCREGCAAGFPAACPRRRFSAHPPETLACERTCLDFTEAPPVLTERAPGSILCPQNLLWISLSYIHVRPGRCQAQTPGRLLSPNGYRPECGKEGKRDASGSSIDTD
jgi:hypothetical protein